MSTTNNITGDKIQSKPANQAWYEAPYWAALDDKLRDKEREARETIQEESFSDIHINLDE